MTLQYTPIAIVSIATAALAVLIALVAWHRRGTPGCMAFIPLMLAIADWTFALAFEAAAVEMTAKVAWAKVEYLGIVSVPVLWLIFVFQYTRADRWLTRRNLVLLWLMPVCTLVLVLTNEWHGLVWGHITPSSSRPTEILVYEHGIWFWFHVAYSYVLMLLGTLRLVQVTARTFHLYRVQSVAMLVSAAIPWVGNAVYLLGKSPIPDVDLTPLSFTLTGLVLAWGMFRYQLFDLVPVARHALIEGMNDGVLVLDARDRIVDVNPAAQRLIGVPATSLIGQGAEMALASWSDIRTHYGDVREAQIEIHVGEEPLPRCVDLHISPLRDQHGHSTGRLIVLRDITERKRAEVELQQANERLREQLAEIRALQAQLHEQATRDPLTGLYNRRHFFELAQHELQRAKRYRGPLSAIMLDLDHFKEVNDTYGHAVGDQVLIAAARRIHDSLRQVDVLCRYGGEEFAILLPKTDITQAQRVAQRIHANISNQPIYVGEHVSSVTASLGVASVSDDTIDLDQLLIHADQALYAAKQAGRNQVEVYTG